MGADLYINQLHEPALKQWEPEFRRAVAARDIAPDETSREAAQARAEHAYEQMYDRGYFRDSYNDSNLLWKFGLSWWTDVIPMLDDKCRLSPNQAGLLLDMLKEREPRFEEAVECLRASEENQFRQRYVALKEFLGTAIELKQPIVCSL